MIKYDKFWKLLKEKNITQTSLIKDFGISPKMLTAMRRNEYIRTASIDRLRRILDCNPEDLFEQEIDDELSETIRLIRQAGLETNTSCGK